MRTSVPKVRRPRNPIAAQALFRQAGPHQKTVGAQRQAAKRDLHQALVRRRWEDLDRS
jgi:hypothetical protein